MSNQIKVAVRTRPLDENKKEKWAQGLDFHGKRISYGARTYDPDLCFPTTATQEDVFNQCTPIFDSVKEGNNGTILVYGQTGTGKTHTMIGSDYGPGAGGQSYDGIAPQAVDYMLDHVRRGCAEGRQMALTLSILEIYMEKISDMLNGGAEVTLAGGWPRQHEMVTVTSADEAKQRMAQALGNRHVSQTAMNERSSRSHVLILLDIHESVGEEPHEQLVTHLFLVDLAGSESLKKSHATGRVAAEAGVINKSLLALKLVILTLSNASQAMSALVREAANEGCVLTASGNKQHVPYRDSKLTELLSDSIGGTARTMFIACINPNGRDIDETKNTLEYATRARSIRNSCTSKERHEIKIRALEAELQKMKNRVLDRIAERGGIFMGKEDYEHYQNLNDLNATQAEEIRQLVADKKTAGTKEKVLTSTLILLQEEVKRQDMENQEAKQKFLEATRKITADATAVNERQREVSRQERQRLCRGWERCRGNALEELQKIRKESDSPSENRALHDVFDTFVRSHNMYNDFVGRALTYGEEALAAAEEVHRSRGQRLKQQLEDHMNATKELYGALNTEQEDAGRELGNSTALFKEHQGKLRQHLATSTADARNVEKSVIPGAFTTYVEEVVDRVQCKLPAEAGSAYVSSDAILSARQVTSIERQLAAAPMDVLAGQGIAASTATTTSSPEFNHNQQHHHHQQSTRAQQQQQKQSTRHKPPLPSYMNPTPVRNKIEGGFKGGVSPSSSGPVFGRGPQESTTTSASAFTNPNLLSSSGEYTAQYTSPEPLQSNSNSNSRSDFQHHSPASANTMNTALYPRKITPLPATTNDVQETQIDGGKGVVSHFSAGSHTGSLSHSSGESALQQYNKPAVAAAAGRSGSRQGRLVNNTNRTPIRGKQASTSSRPGSRTNTPKDQQRTNTPTGTGGGRRRGNSQMATSGGAPAGQTRRGHTPTHQRPPFRGNTPPEGTRMGF